MAKALLGGVLALLFGVQVRAAQTNEVVTITNWEAAVSNVQLSISLPNTVITSASNVTIVAWIKNGSDNAIGLFQNGQPAYDFDVWLIDASGKESIVRPKPSMRIGNHIGPITTIEPGGMKKLEIPIFNWYSDLKPGRYTLRVEKTCYGFRNGNADRDNKLRLVSNLLEVQINGDAKISH